MDRGIKSRKAVILSGTRGIGLAIAETPANAGVDIAICARNAEQGCGKGFYAGGERRSGHGCVGRYFSLRRADRLDLIRRRDAWGASGCCFPVPAPWHRAMIHNAKDLARQHAASAPMLSRPAWSISRAAFGTSSGRACRISTNRPSLAIPWAAWHRPRTSPTGRSFSPAPCRRS
jgi:hypothetical protein